MSETPEWTTPEKLSALSAGELNEAMAYMGITVHGVFNDVDGNVVVHFYHLADAEALLTLAIESSTSPGSLYDRATSSCVKLNWSEETGLELTDEQVAEIIEEGWKWMIHPHMVGRKMGWHASVTMTPADANQVTANLNTLRLGGAL